MLQKNMATHPHVLFLSQVQTDKPDSCWTWRGCKNNMGYGVFAWSKNRTGAHRYSWMFFNNRDIPIGKMVLHSCHRPDCVNPLHLRIGDQFDNMSDRKLIGNYLRGENHVNSVISNEDAKAIYFDRRTCRVIAESYGVSRDVVQRIRSGQTYTDATGGGRSEYQREKGRGSWINR